MQCFCWKLVKMSNFGRLKSANGHILDRLFPILRQIPKIHLTYMVGIIQELLFRTKRYVLPNAVFFLEICDNGPLLVD